MNERPENSHEQPAKWLASADEREAAALAESWAALRQLLDAASPEVNEAALLAGIESRLAAQQTRPQLVQRAIAAAGVVLALAAALLVAVTIGSRQAAPDANPGAPQVAETPSMPDEPSTQFAWDDDFSSQLESAQASVRWVEGNWRQGPDAAAIVREQIDEFVRELEETPL